MFLKPKSIIFLFLIIYLVFRAAAVCPTDYLYNTNGYCYGLPNNTAESFLDASFTCFQTQHGVLVGLSSLPEQNIIPQLLAQKNISCVSSCALWLGWTNYHYSDHDGEFYWMDFKSNSTFINSILSPTAAHQSSDHALYLSYNGVFNYQLVGVHGSTTAWPICSLPAANNTGTNGCSAPANWMRLTASTMYYFDSTLRTVPVAKCFCDKKGGHAISISSMAEIVYLRHISSLYNLQSSSIFLGMEKTDNCTPGVSAPVAGYGESFNLRGRSAQCSSWQCGRESCYRGGPDYSAVFRWADLGCYASSGHMYASVCESFPHTCPADKPPSGSATNVPDALELPCTAYQANAVTTTSSTMTPRYVVCPPDFTTAEPETTSDTTVKPTTEDLTTRVSTYATTMASIKSSRKRETTLQSTNTQKTEDITNSVTNYEATTQKSTVKETSTSKPATTSVPFEATTMASTEAPTVAVSTRHATFKATAASIVPSKPTSSPIPEATTGGTTKTSTVPDTTQSTTVTTASPPSNSPVILTSFVPAQLNTTSSFLTTLLQSASTAISTTLQTNSRQVGKTTVMVRTKSSSRQWHNSGTQVSEGTTGVSGTVPGPVQTQTTSKQRAPNRDDMIGIPADNSKFPMVAGVVAIVLMVCFFACCILADAPALFTSLKFGISNVSSFVERCFDKRKKRKKPKSRRVASKARVSPTGLSY